MTTSRILMLAGAAAMLGAAPALAEKPGKGHGHKAHSTKSVGHKASAKASAKASTKAARNTTRARRDRDRDGIDDRDEALARKYGGALCPPGLAKKTPACMPPGQAKRQFREGQRVSSNYRHYTRYSDIPTALRDRFALDEDNRYIYRDNVLYTVDPRTRVITSIVDAIL